MLSLLFCSSFVFGVKDYSKPDDSFYGAVARWIASVNWVDKLKIAATAKKMKNVEWSKIAEKLKDIYNGK